MIVKNCSLTRTVLRGAATLSNCSEIGVTAPGLTLPADAAAHPFGHGRLVPLGNGMGGRDVPLSDVLGFPDFCLLAKLPVSAMGDSVSSTPAPAVAALLERVQRRTAELSQAVHVQVSSSFSPAVKQGPAEGVGFPSKGGPPPHPAWTLSPSAVASVTLAYPFCDIGAGAILLHCPSITRVRTRGPVAVVASTVEDCLLQALPSLPSRIAEGGVVTSSVLHPGSQVDGNSHCSSSLLFQLAGVRRHGIVMESVLAPGSAVQEGELSHCLLGPLVGFHHQALLIACLWPTGKGNVAYGANVGSNHTGKLPDQEHLGGEGLFFGLSVNIKYPCDYSEAPYSLIASCVNCLPQRLRMPFSLINGAGAGTAAVPALTSAINEVMPAWMLSDNCYAVYRNEMKFEQRCRSIEGMQRLCRKEKEAAAAAAASAAAVVEGAGHFDASYLSSGGAAPELPSSGILDRPDIALLLVQAREKLLRAKKPLWQLGSSSKLVLEPAPQSGGAAAGAGAQPMFSSSSAPTPTAIPKTALYLETEIEGLGKNYCSEASRLKAIATYSKYIRLFVLKQLAKAALGAGAAAAAAGGAGSAASAFSVQLHGVAAILAVKEGVMGVPSDAAAAAGPTATLSIPREQAASLLEEYCRMLEGEALEAEKSKGRDDQRGSKSFPQGFYESAHKSAREDSVVLYLKGKAAAARADVAAWRGQLQAGAGVISAGK